MLPSSLFKLLLLSASATALVWPGFTRASHRRALLPRQAPGGFGGFGGGGSGGGAPGSGGHPTFTGIPAGIPTGIPTNHPTGAPAPAASPSSSGGGSGGGSGGACPAVWSKVSSDLVGKFTDGAPEPGQCNDLARAAIRAAFHDCGTWTTSMGDSAGCDGSLFLAGEYSRPENKGLETAVPQLGALAQSYGVGVADFFQFAAGELLPLL
jgi:Peroxidase